MSKNRMRSANFSYHTNAAAVTFIISSGIVKINNKNWIF